MKKIIVALGLALSLLAPAAVFAQEDLLTDPGITPDSWLYTFDLIAEKVEEFFTFSTEAKARLALEVAEERLAESEAMCERNQNELAVRARERYQERFSMALTWATQAQGEGKDAVEVIANIAEATLRHSVVLEERLDQTADDAKEAVSEVIGDLNEKNTESLKSLSEEKGQQIVEEVEGKISDLEEKLPDSLKKKVQGIKGNQ